MTGPGTTLPARARRRCGYCGHRCHGRYSCVYCADLPRLDTGHPKGIRFAVVGEYALPTLWDELHGASQTTRERGT